MRGDDDVGAVEALPVEVVDTIGAGDAFMGAFLAHWRSRGLAELGRREELIEATASPAAWRPARVLGRAPSRRGAPSWTARPRQLLAAALPPLRPAARFCARLPPPRRRCSCCCGCRRRHCRTSSRPCSRHRGVGDRRGAALAHPLPRSPSYCLSFLTLGPWSFCHRVLSPPESAVGLRVTRLIGRQPGPAATLPM